MSYAKNTKVNTERTRGEIERLLSKNGATKFMSGWSETGAAIMFEMNARRIRFEVPLPDAQALARDGKRKRTPMQIEKLVEAETKRRWRALLLVIKAKIEVVASGITSFEDEFLAYIVMPTGETVGTAIRDSLAAAYSGKPLPPLLHEHT